VIQLKHVRNGLAGLAVAAMTATPAFAHHPLGGGTPETFVHGVLSGIGHPMLGIDHFAFLFERVEGLIFPGVV